MDHSDVIKSNAIIYDVINLQGYGKKIQGASAIPWAARSLSVLDASSSGKASVTVNITQTMIPTIVPIRIGNNRKQYSGLVLEFNVKISKNFKKSQKISIFLADFRWIRRYFTHVHFFSLKLYPGNGMANRASTSMHRMRTNMTITATAQFPLQ